MSKYEIHSNSACLPKKSLHASKTHFTGTFVCGSQQHASDILWGPRRKLIEDPCKKINNIYLKVFFTINTLDYSTHFP